MSTPAPRRTSRSWRGCAPLRRHRSQRNAPAAPTTPTTPELSPTRPSGGVTPVCLDSDPSHQRFYSEITQVSPESIYTSYEPRDEEPRHRPSTDAAAGKISESSEFLPLWGPLLRDIREITKSVNGIGLNTLSLNGIFKQQ
jgi:hypothetical protein